ncbi:protein kinase, partial [candidate division KSB3 bacterium]|nr:protein kinase [candidate division KSB3 bacterium]MBD3323726.1 protein kinase [candidate division KSB3 bacterium]
MSTHEDQTLTGGTSPDPEQTLTHRSPKSPKEALTLTGGGPASSEHTMTLKTRLEESDLTLTRTVGVGTGELVDKVNWEAGDIIDGKYEVLANIGRGGMSIVYKIKHLEWKLELAVKMPLAHLVADEASKARFIREAQTWVDLGLHPNIVQCWYVRELGGIPRVFMDYINDGSLKDWIKAGKVQPGEWETILDLVIQACDGLGYAHERGVHVHRDVKPGNLMLTDNGDLLVTDFGIVKRDDSKETESAQLQPSTTSREAAVTQTGLEVGTPEYGAPEQWRKAAHVDARADIYGLGVVLFELCCGRRPFDDGSHGEPAYVLIGRHLSTPAPDPREFNPDIPASLTEIILQCLEKDPDKRPPSMANLRELLIEAYRRIVGKTYRRAEPQAAELRSDALNNRAVSLVDLGKITDALKAWDAALKLDAYHPEAIYNTSLFEWRTVKITDDEVVKRLEEAKHVSLRASLYLGFIHLERAEAERAEDEFVHVLTDAEFATNGGVWRALGDARMAQQKYEQAAKAYQKALELIPGDSESLERQKLAQAYSRTKNDHVEFAWQRCARSFDKGHQEGVTAAAITPNGRFVVSGSRDTTLRVWEIE